MFPLALQRRLVDGAGRLAPRSDGIRTKTGSVGAVRGAWIEPEGEATGTILYLHGGGYVVGSARSHERFVGHLVERCGARAFVADYRLAPQHPWPAALADARLAYLAIRAREPDGRLVVVGDSAGGGLAVALAMELRDRGERPPDALALLCPWLDLTAERPGRGDAVLTTSSLERWSRMYAPGATDRADAWVSPVLGDLGGLPPTIVHAAADDPLQPDARRFDARARAAGMSCSLTEFDGLWHDFHLLAGRSRDADDALELLARQLAPHLGRTRPIEVAIIGAGMSGICMAATLRRAGIDSFRILEKAEAIGGTWRDNRYPGLSCDVPSRLYSYSFLPNPAWSQVFAAGPEIRSYFDRAADELGIRGDIELGWEVASASWDGTAWDLESTDGRRHRADVVVTATGVLHHPRMPDLPGLDEFEGRSFHSARWPGDVDLTGQRVAVVGTGSTSAQIVAAIASQTAQLHVLQRSAQWILPIPNRPYGPRIRQVLTRLPFANRAIYSAYRTGLTRLFGTATTEPGAARWAISTAARLNLRLGVKDPELRRRVTPDHEPMCRRLIMSAGYYSAIQRPNVTIETERIERIESKGVRLADGRLIEVDILVLATGFDAHAYLRPMAVAGAGRTLEEAWADGPRAYRTVALPGFPNLFTIMGPHSPIGNFSLIAVAESQAAYVLGWIEALRRGEVVAVSPTDEATDEATDEYNAELRAALPDTVWASGCTSWYLGPDGLPELWPWSPERHRRMLEERFSHEFEQIVPNAVNLPMT
jgi:cation diffusion facilitator CzcD-associated flavoprotein CzcO/acetyl esterase/lipase